ncbi:MAG TPA: ATP-binding cassette domain-containing protein [Candidatus Flavonifractor merdigallinarum]|uniref:ATP-binding cassette domain-containing protein n=1 Tax=Candidatus Flavonifractor merdigallinarum TaxID=2838589 RepID=A0A9D2BZG9_9FIRM|nr:ATP-binding cassette domain-containing protein [Candidatus Flavonifractor merdigallinarum]
MTPLLSVKNVTKTFPAGKGMKASKARVHAVNNISFDIYPGETFSVVGESGCGKSTTGRLVDHLLVPDSGEIWFNGQDISKLSEKEMRPLRKDIQMIFQDPNGSLNPRMRVEDLVAEPLLVHTNLSAGERLKVVHELLQIVGLGAKHARRYPHEFSGGQRQRIGIARALTVRPKLIIADEPVSALDVSIQAQVLNLMQKLQQDYDLTYLFISHDLSVVEMISDRIAVMYLGSIVELAPKKELYGNPKHPYTKALLSAVPIPDPTANREHELLQGDIPSTINLPVGCPFQTRCPRCTEACKQKPIEPRDLGNGHIVSCIHIDD